MKKEKKQCVKNLSDEEFCSMEQIRNLCKAAKEEVEIPQTLENKLNTLIDNWAAAEKPKTFALLKIWLWTGSIAASAALILSVGFYFLNNDKNTQYADNLTINVENLSEPDRAKIIKAEHTLMLVSQNYNKGLNALHKAEKQIQQTQNIVNKSFNKNF
ncbi:hypothetical protein FACS189429_8770 [Bacteroidia bacterium]|nr:hypothetical protein FACS189429_8770 [Bacteroidia bacterium]GHV44797.1 hypothetical protein FACS1894180_6580 [Bacteroidia bacterium]